MADSYPITPKGLLALKDELKHRKETERMKIVRAIEEARAHGDISENAEFTAAKEAQSLNEGRIGKLEELIALANVIDPATLSGRKVVFGATVTLEDEATWTLTDNAYLTAFTGRVGSIITNGFTVFVNGVALT